MKSAILLACIVAACLLEVFAIAFAAWVFTHHPRSLEIVAAIIAIILAALSLGISTSVYRRVKKSQPPASP